MNDQTITLVEPTIKLETEFLAMAEEFSAAGDDRYKRAANDFSGYISQKVNAHRGENLPPERVPESEYWLVLEDYIIGRSKLRHRLNPFLEEEGGHIGYDIRPAARRKGYGILILKLTLEKARDLGLTRVLLTCDEDNIGSANIIKAGGGVLSEKAISKKTGKPILRYWIELW